MADEKKAVKEKKEVSKESKVSKFVNFFKNLPQKIATPFKNMWHELKKVTWPTKQDLIKYTCIVLLFMVFMGIVIGLLDMGASKLVTAVSSLNRNEEQIIIDSGDAATTAESPAEEAADAVDNAVEEAADSVEKAVEEAAESVEQVAEKVADQITQALEPDAEENVETTEAPASGK